MVRNITAYNKLTPALLPIDDTGAAAIDGSILEISNFENIAVHVKAGEVSDGSAFETVFKLVHGNEVDDPDDPTEIVDVADLADTDTTLDTENSGDIIEVDLTEAKRYIQLVAETTFTTSETGDDVKIDKAINPVVSSEGANNGVIIDRRYYDTAKFNCSVGAVAGAPDSFIVVFKVQHGDAANLSDVADVVGATTTITAINTDAEISVDLTSVKRYIRCVGTVAFTTSETGADALIDKAINPVVSSTGANNGVIIDRRYYDTAKFQCQVGATTGTPTSFSVAFKVEEGDAANLSDKSDIVGATTTITTVNTDAEIDVDLSAVKRYIRLVATAAFVEGETPTVVVGGAYELSRPDILLPISASYELSRPDITIPLSATAVLGGARELPYK